MSDSRPYLVAEGRLATDEEIANMESWPMSDSWWDEIVHLTPRRCFNGIAVFVPFIFFSALFLVLFFSVDAGGPNAVCVFTDVSVNRTDNGDHACRIVIVVNATLDVYSSEYASKKTPWSRVITAKSVDAAEYKIMRKFYVGRRADCWIDRRGISLKADSVDTPRVLVATFLGPFLLISALFPVAAVMSLLMGCYLRKPKKHAT